MHRSLIFILIGTFVVMSLTAASYLVLTKFNPEREIRFMLREMSKLTSVSQNSGFSWTRTEGEDRTTTTLYTVSELDLSQQAVIDHQTTFRIVRVNDSNTYADLSGEMRGVDGVTYLSYEPPAPTVSGFDFNTSDTWVSFKPGELSLLGSIIPGIDQPINLTLTTSSWTPEGIDRVRTLLSIADVFLVAYDNLTEEVSGIETRVIEAWFDPDALRAFLFALIRAKEGREPTDDERIVAEMQARQLERLTMRLWIGKDDHLLYRAQAAGAFVEEGSTDLIPVDVRIDFHDMNKSVSIYIPKSSTSISTILRSILLPAKQRLIDEKSELPVQTINISDDPDNDGLDNLLETFYGTNARRADTDGDGMSDGEEVVSGRNPRGKGTLFGFGL